jgi:hypothetical protein
LSESVGLGLRDGAAPPEEVARKRPGLAWLLGSLCPGLGATYLGKFGRAAWTGIPFAIAIAILWNAQSGEAVQVWVETAFRYIFFLYIFSFVDSYYTAREINSGVDAVAGDLNPRIAAVLNFLTNGLGYFYVGEKKLGILLFILLGYGLRLLEPLAEGLTGMALLAVILAELGMRAGLAWDAYRRSIAQRRERLAGTPLEIAPGAPAQHLEVPAAGPLIVAGLIAALYLLLNVVGALFPPEA